MKVGDLVEVFNGISTLEISHPIGHGIIVEKITNGKRVWWRILDRRGDIITWSESNLELVSESR